MVFSVWPLDSFRQGKHGLRMLLLNGLSIYLPVVFVVFVCLFFFGNLLFVVNVLLMDL